ncbi:hypothetical protein Q5P01_021995 [Channa striata]|uniref:Uncharacterized protein n=1 Tax=Channa striata TaxID=64152 RepID=A0AA88IVG1_CHASR|nr:hypothetical protein Q5P01_021995 [Channa striata]
MLVTGVCVQTPQLVFMPSLVLSLSDTVATPVDRPIAAQQKKRDASLASRYLRRRCARARRASATDIPTLQKSFRFVVRIKKRRTGTEKRIVPRRVC